MTAFAIDAIVFIGHNWQIISAMAIAALTMGVGAWIWRR